MDEKIWHLLHEERPDDQGVCYFGFKDRTGKLITRKGDWSESGNDWIVGDRRSCTPAFGDWSKPYHPADLPFNIYWAYQSDFSLSSNLETAHASLQSFLSQP